MGRDTFGVSGRLKALLNIGLWGCVKGWAVQEINGLILTIYASYGVFLCKDLRFRGHDDWNCINIFSGVNFLKSQLIP